MKKPAKCYSSSSDVKDGKLDRQEVFKKLYAGHEVQYTDMFDTRGYRGLNFLPFPEHIKQDIQKGLISQKLAYSPGKILNKQKKVDFTNYNEPNEDLKLFKPFQFKDTSNLKFTMGSQMDDQ